MAKSISTFTAANPFQVWFNKTNEIANAISQECLTANTNANGAITTGNSFLVGIFGANTITVFSELRGGNVQTANTLVVSSALLASNASGITIGNSTINAVINSTSLTIGNSSVNISITSPTAAQKSDGTYFLNANGSYISIATDQITTANVTTSGTSAQLVDSFAHAVDLAGSYVAHIRNNVDNGYSMIQLNVLYDGTDTFLNQYGILESNGNLGDFSANANSSHVRLYVTPVPSNTTVRVVRTRIK